MSTKPDMILTVRDLDLMPDDGKRYEVIDGELFVSKTPGLFHQLISGTIYSSFDSYLKENPIGKVVSTPGVILSDLDGVIPDLIFIRSEKLAAAVESDRIHGAPELVVEILSPGSDNARRDRIAKLYLYAKFGVREYWIVDPETRTIELYIRSGNNLILSGTFGAADKISSTVLLGYSCNVADLFAI